MTYTCYQPCSTIITSLYQPVSQGDMYQTQPNAENKNKTSREWRMLNVYRCAWCVSVCLYVSESQCAKRADDSADTYGHSSSSSDRTLDRRLLKLRWTPEHSIQTSAPKLRLAQTGSTNTHITAISSVVSVVVHMFTPQLSPVPSYAACWQRHMGLNNLPKIATWPLNH